MGEIRKCTQADCVAISQFMEKHFPNRPEAIVKRSRTSAYYKWKYDPNPFGETIMYTYWEKHELLGIFGAIPEQLIIRGKQVLAYQLVDAFVAPQMHGKGIFRLLADKVFDDIDRLSEITFGIGPSAYSLPIFTKKYNMYVAPTYRQVFSPIRFDDILRAKHLNFISPIGNLVNIIRNNVLTKPHIKIEEISDIETYYYPTLTEESDFSICRDQEYVKFRYKLCPDPYRFFKVCNDDNDVVLIVKFIQWRTMTICYLIDVIGNLRKERLPLFLCQALYAIGIRTSSALVSVELHTPRNDLAKLKYHGFMCHNREECLFMRQNSWPFLTPSSEDYDSKRWIIFSGDSDHI